MHFFIFERKCFRVDIETSVAKIRRSTRISLIQFAREAFVAVQLVVRLRRSMFYREACSGRLFRGACVFRNSEMSVGLHSRCRRVSQTF